MTPLLPHVREPAGEPDVCSYCCEDWMDVDPSEACPLRSLGLATIRELNAMPRSASEGGGWALWACPPADINIPRATGATEGEALVAALESAP